MKKIIGWFLLIAGLVIIFWVIYSSYQIFTAKTEAPEIFKVTKTEVSQQQAGGGLSPEEAMQKTIESKLGEIIPEDFLPRLFNLIAWSILAIILFFGGCKISEIGIKLIKQENDTRN